MANSSASNIIYYFHLLCLGFLGHCASSNRINMHTHTLKASRFESCIFKMNVHLPGTKAGLTPVCLQPIKLSAAQPLNQTPHVKRQKSHAVR